MVSPAKEPGTIKLVVLDRDGVINHDSPEYIKTPEEWQPIPGSLEAIARLNHSGYRVIVASNQSGLGRRLFGIEVLNRIHEKMRRQLAESGGTIEAIFFCPHAPKDRCTCRKPLPGLLLEASSRLRIPLGGVPMVGDSLCDVEAARAAGALPVLVRTGKGTETLDTNEDLDDVAVHDDLSAFVDACLADLPGPVTRRE